MPAWAQEPPSANVKVETDGDYLVLSINETDGLPLEEFIKLAEQLTRKTFTYSKTDISNSPDNKITFIGSKRIRKENFFPFFQTMLYIKGFATLLRGDEDTEVIEIIYMQGPKRGELSSSARYVAPEDIASYANQTGVTILTSIPLAHTDPNQATNQLRPFFLGTAGAGTSQLQFGAASKSLLLEGFGPQVYAAYQLLQLVDVAQEAPDQELRVMRLTHAAAEELEPIVKEILEGQARAAVQVQQGVSGAALQTGQAQEIRVVPHNTLNALILSGTHEQILEAQELIAELDTQVESVDGDSHVIRLKNVLADTLHETLNRFITDEQAADQQSQTGQGAQARRPRKTVVVPFRESNALLIGGTKTKFQQLQRMIDQLDVRQPQVLIECAVIELTSSDQARLGVELAAIDVGGDDFTRPFGFTSFGLTTLQDTNGDGLPDSRLPDVDNPPQGFTGGIISTDDFAVPIIVNALASDQSANVLSMPSVVVNNNESALVTSEEQRPTQQISQGNATTQAGAGNNVPAGIVLNISPSISTNNYLRLNLDLTVSRFVSPFDPNAVTAGVIAERKISTQVTLPSGHTMVLGGVLEDLQNDQSSGIPLLKDIPLLGWLFSSWNTTKTKTNLYFFLTPYILDEEDFSDLAEQSFRKKLEAAEYIGHRRIQLIDRKWRPGRPETLEDPGATIEDIDARGGFEMPIYERPDRTIEAEPGSTGPRTPDATTGDPTTGPPSTTGIAPSTTTQNK